MRKAIALLFFFSAVFLGVWTGQKPARQKAPLPKVHPETEFPIAERKSFVFIVYGHNQAPWCERCLRSIFEQEYDVCRVIFIDDGSSDATFETAREFIVQNRQDHRVILVRNETSFGLLACLFRAVDSLLDKEIVIPIDAKDWLAHSGALARLNAAYQNPDVWFASAGGLDYPSYEIEPDGLKSFYAALFKKLRLADLFEGRKSTEFCLQPLLDLSGGRSLAIPAPLLFLNRTQAQRVAPPSPANSPRTDPLAEFPKAGRLSARTDIVLFSFDRPMQLYACLESLRRYVSGYESLSVLYRASDDRFAAGYEKVKEAFPEARYIRQPKMNPKRDFKPLLLKTLFDSPSEFVLFGVDDMVVKDAVDLKFCMEMMEKTGAYGFYLRFGRNIDYCYQVGLPQPVPESVPLVQNVYAWSIHAGPWDWNWPNVIDMTLFRKSELKEAFEKMKYKTPNSLESAWTNEYAPKKALGLYFEQSKVVNIPLNVVGKTGNPHMSDFSTEDLLAKFDEGWKIDIDPLHRIDNRSPHFEHVPEFVAR